jgi:carboxyl-terminal processing protease
MGSMELLDDQYTRFIPPEIAERSRIQIQGGYEGIGAYVDLDEAGNLLIVRPIDGQPADKAGLLSGDIVTQVNGQSITGMPLVEIVALITGPRGTEVRLTIVRDETGETFEVTIIRERIDFPVVSSRMLDENIGYVRLTTFSNGADQKLSMAIEELLAQEPMGLILDLRDNPGGLLAEAIEISDLFLPEGIVAYQRDTQGVERVFKSDSGDLAETIPLVLLVNSGSASGSEIVAGAIRDLERGIIIGEQTLGKGSVQQSYTLSDGSELRVTIARWYTPNNLTIDKEGILPDIEIDNPVDLGGEDDEQLQRAIEFILEGK